MITGAFLNLKFQHIYMANKEDESKKSIHHIWFDKEQDTINHIFRTNLNNVKYWPCFWGSVHTISWLCSYHFNHTYEYNNPQAKPTCIIWSLFLRIHLVCFSKVNKKKKELDIGCNVWNNFYTQSYFKCTLQL